MSDRRGFFDRNKIVAFAIIIGCMLFVGIFFLEKSKKVVDLIPRLRGEVLIGNNLVITTTSTHYPIIIRTNDPKLRAIRYSGKLQLEFDEIVHNLYSNNSVIVEVGAHFGERTLEFGHKVKPLGKVYAFEPNLSVFKNIRKSIVLNDLEETIVLKNVAIADHYGSININDSKLITDSDNGARVNRRKITVNCNTLDAEMASEKKQIDLLVIDIPGSEFTVLRGCYGIISQSPDIIIILSFDNNVVSSDAHIELQRLESMGFKFYVANEEMKLNNISLEKLLGQKNIVVVASRKVF